MLLGEIRRLHVFSVSDIEITIMAENGHENGTNGATAEKRKAENGENGHSGAAKKEKLEGGTLLFSGATDWKLVGRKGNELVKSSNTQWSPVRLAALEDISIVGVNKGMNAHGNRKVNTNGRTKKLRMSQ